MAIPEKTLERLKPYIIAIFSIFPLMVWVIAQSTGDYGGGSTQPSPGYKFVGAGSTTVGVTGNVVTVSSSGGGGSAAAAVTNADNLFLATSQNTYLAPSYLNGVSNVFGAWDSTGTNYINGRLMVNTNNYSDNNNIAVFATQGARNNVTIFGTSPALFMGNPFGSGYGDIYFSGTTFAIDTPSVNLAFQISNGTKIGLTGTSATYGDNSSFAHTFNGVVTNLSTTHLAGAVTLGSTIAGKTPANLLTNMASSSGSVITYTGQGTSTMTPVVNYGIVVTNGMTANMGNATNYSAANLKFQTTYTTGLVYTVQASDSIIACITTGQSVRVILPTSATTGRRISVIKTDESGFSAIVDAGSSLNINGNTNLIINTKYQMIDLFNTGTEWFAK